jgi:hypothetical protein
VAAHRLAGGHRVGLEQAGPPLQVGEQEGDGALRKVGRGAPGAPAGDAPRSPTAPLRLALGSLGHGVDAPTPVVNRGAG